MTRQVLGRQSETGDVRSRDGEPGGIGEEWLAKREWWCYESEYSASKTKQALSRYKVVTGAITKDMWASRGLISSSSSSSGGGKSSCCCSRRVGWRGSVG
jgi:hypothetical protein